MADESAEITLNNNNNSNSKFELVQPFKAETVANTTSTATSNEVVEVKPLSQTLEVKPLSQSLELKPLNQTSKQTSDQTLEIKPLNVDSRQEIAVTDPIRTDASSTVDLKPVALDVCVRTGQASIPPTHICEPYNHRIGLSLLGVEVFGIAWCGESQTIVDDRRMHPSIAWGAVMPSPPLHVSPPHAPPPARKKDHRGGLHIRLTD
jgi:hypothetical protein